MQNFKVLFLSLFILGFISCKTDEVDGVIIGDTLYVHQSLNENLRMKRLIKEALQKEEKGVFQLITFPNGGAASSYDLGYVITQIIYRIGEEDFLRLIKDFDYRILKNLEGSIVVGLEYGDNDYDGKMDNLKIENEFPKIKNYIDEKL